MNLEDKLLTLSNGEKYMIIESVSYENKKYAYIVNVNKDLDTLFVEMKEQDGNIVFDEIEQEYLEEKILPLFIEKFSK